MVFDVIRHHVLTRLIAAFIVALVVSPYSEPFATMSGTDFGGAGAVDVGGGSKFKATPDVLASPPVVVVFAPAVVVDPPAILPSVTLDSRARGRAILRL
jgi:hypothetical protein